MLWTLDTIISIHNDDDDGDGDDEKEVYIHVTKIRLKKIPTLSCLTACDTTSLEPVSSPLYPNGSNPILLQ